MLIMQECFYARLRYSKWKTLYQGLASCLASSNILMPFTTWSVIFFLAQGGSWKFTSSFSLECISLQCFAVWRDVPRRLRILFFIIIDVFLSSKFGRQSLPSSFMARLRSRLLNVPQPSTLGSDWLIVKTSINLLASTNKPPSIRILGAASSSA